MRTNTLVRCRANLYTRGEFYRDFIVWYARNRTRRRGWIDVPRDVPRLGKSKTAGTTVRLVLIELPFM